METRQLRTADLHISPLGFGARAAGGADWPGGIGQQNDADSIAAINRAVELGVNWIDTAPVYGLGHSEEIVGQAVNGRSMRPYIVTKCGVTWDGQGNVQHSLKAASVRREVEDSLRRLGIEAIDLYMVHHPIPDDEIEEAWSTMADLRAEGKVRHLGVSNFSVDQLRRVMPIAPVTALEAEYSLLARRIESDLLPFARANGIAVLAYSPMKSGLLTGKMTRERVAALAENDFRRTDPEFQEPRLSRNLELVEVLRAIGARHGRTPGEVAVAWVLRQPGITAAIIGGRRPSQVEGIAGAAALPLSDGDLAEIEGFLQMDA